MSVREFCKETAGLKAWGIFRKWCGGHSCIWEREAAKDNPGKVGYVLISRIQRRSTGDV